MGEVHAGVESAPRMSKRGAAVVWMDPWRWYTATRAQVGCWVLICGVPEQVNLLVNATRTAIEANPTVSVRLVLARPLSAFTHASAVQRGLYLRRSLSRDEKGMKKRRYVQSTPRTRESLPGRRSYALGCAEIWG